MREYKEPLPHHILTHSTPEGFASFTSGEDVQYSEQNIGQNIGQISRILDTKIDIFGENIGHGWLTIEDLSQLTGKNYFAIQKAVKRRKFRYIREIKSAGRDGKRYLIHITDPAIPAEAQVRWIKENKELVLSLPDFVIEKFHPQAQWEIIRLKQPKEQAMIEKVDTKKAEQRLALIQRAMAVPQGWKRSRWIEQPLEELKNKYGNITNHRRIEK